MTKTGCIAIDHVFPGGDKPISDAELMIYKLEGEASSVRAVGITRKRAISFVRQFILFYYFLEYIMETVEDAPAFHYRPGIDSLVDGVLALRHIRASKVPFEPWMFPFVLDPEVQKKFLVEKGGSEPLSLTTVFGLRAKELERLKTAVYHMQKRNTLF